MNLLFLSMSDSIDDFLTARLGDILTNENNDIDSQEEAVPWKCWGRGGTRPSLSKINLERFLEISERCRNSNSTDEIEVKTSPKTLPLFPPKKENIMESISSECHEILGNPRTDKHIAEWLQQNFSEAIEKQSNPIQHQLSQNNNTGVKEKSVASQLFMSKLKTPDHEYSDTLYQLPSDSLSSSVNNHSTSNSSQVSTTFMKGITCIPNRSNSFTIENLPNNVTRNELMQVLCSFGTVENILIRESEENVTANIRMGAECNCAWIIDCLNGSQPFGGASI